MAESMRIYGPSSAAPQTTEQVARCQVCETQWQVWGAPPVNTQGCGFCGAPAKAITVISEAATYNGAVVR